MFDTAWRGLFALMTSALTPLVECHWCLSLSLNAVNNNPVIKALHFNPHFWPILQKVIIEIFVCLFVSAELIVTLTYRERILIVKEIKVRIFVEIFFWKITIFLFYEMPYYNNFNAEEAVLKHFKNQWWFCPKKFKKYVLTIRILDSSCLLSSLQHGFKRIALNLVVWTT